uniref:Uncharacterized protein n=1 Tax=Oryzias sinensis TaxID=183150 RepID=A0A8C7YZB6_9TELE
MCVSRCLRCVGVALVPMAIVCMLCNTLLLFPELKPHFLLEKHVTREATWATGLWASGLMVCTSTGVNRALYSGLAFLATAVHLTLTHAAPCLLNCRFLGYLHNRTLWSGVCLEPKSVVQWNMVLFSVMAGTSALEAVLCAVNILNALFGLVLGPGFCKPSETFLMLCGTFSKEHWNIDQHKEFFIQINKLYCSVL